VRSTICDEFCFVSLIIISVISEYHHHEASVYVLKHPAGVFPPAEDFGIFLRQGEAVQLATGRAGRQSTPATIL
jgi:hypothetical protein